MVVGSAHRYPIFGRTPSDTCSYICFVAIALHIILMNKLKINSDRVSALAVVILILIIGLLSKHQYWIYVALCLAILSLLSARFSFVVHRVWTYISTILGKINSWIVLSIVYLLIVIPTSMVKNIYSKIKMRGKKKEIIVSAFKAREHTYMPKDFENPW